MSIRAILALLLLVAAAGLAVPAFAEEHGESDDGAPGEEFSAFLQTTETEMDAAVDDGVFDARLERADEAEREEIVEQRVEALERRADRAEQRLDELERTGSNGSVAYRARAAGVSAQLAALNRSLETTERRADDAGVDSERLDELRTRTSELSGRETARLARSIAGPSASVPGNEPPAGVGNGTGPGGPPDDVGDDATELGPDAPPVGDPGPGTGDDGAEDGDSGAGDGDGDRGAGGGPDRTDDGPGNADGPEDGAPPGGPAEGDDQ